jgi:uncharacterized repeat protein (TIGR01451 family)
VSIVGTNLLYTPSTNFHGTNVMAYVITDGNGGSATGLVTVVVTPVNDLPVAIDDAASTPEDVPVTISVLTNDFDVDGDTLTITNATSTNGTVSIVGTNLLYTPSTNFHGTNVMAYVITDGNGGSATGLVTVVVTAVNDPPVANNDTTNTPQNVSVTINPRVNDSDPDGDALTIISVSPTNGTASIVGGTNVLFTPTIGFAGTATIGYTISDGNGGTASALITITVTGVPTTADLAVFKSGPTNVTAGNAIVYTIIVTNQGPATATNVVLKDFLPTNLVFVSASPTGGLTNFVLTWPTVPRLAAGASTNYTLTAMCTNLVDITNRAQATSITSDPDTNNNNGTLPTSQVATRIYRLDLGVLTGTPAFNPQTSLYEERVTVTNRGEAAIVGMRLYPVGLRATKEFLMFATGTNAGQPYVQFNVPLAPGEFVTFQVDILSLDNRRPTNTFRVEATVAIPSAPVSGTDVTITRVFLERVSGVEEPVIEFTSVPGRIYGVAYSDNGGVSWKVATPYVTATTTTVQWIDSGPPKTDTPSSSTRWYRVLLWP